MFEKLFNDCFSIYFSFLFISVGSSATLVSLKVYCSCSMIVGNFIDIYLFGLLAVLMNWFFQVFSFGWLLCSFLFYLFLHRLEMFLLVLSLLECFSSLFQSLTLSNRLSINLLSGSLLIELLSVAVRFFLFWFFFWLFLLWIVFSFEMLNSGIQLFIFSLLHLEYSFFHRLEILINNLYVFFNLALNSLMILSYILNYDPIFTLVNSYWTLNSILCHQLNKFFSEDPMLSYLWFFGRLLLTGTISLR